MVTPKMQAISALSLHAVLTALEVVPDWTQRLPRRPWLH